MKRVEKTDLYVGKTRMMREGNTTTKKRKTKENVDENEKEKEKKETR